ncbi:MAG: flavodoxin family protein [Candidatus Bathyarchaeota archaeon]|nr:flavodoxin family protein [Candidatus Bathyarchaeota archaeon]
MKITALVGSPRKMSNTDILVDKILEDGAKKGYSSEKIYLYDQQIKPCIDCRACKRGELECIIIDDMRKIYGSLDSADIIIFGTPIYFYGPTGPMKTLIDRLRPYIANKKLRGKKGILVVPSEEGPECTEPLVELYKMSFHYLGLEYLGAVLATAYEKAEILKKPGELALIEDVIKLF